ncbi:MAG: hypothetical protein FWH41_09645 [Treponema sp.]|nr:hypothetical protein [Treponema sp.]
MMKFLFPPVKVIINLPAPFACKKMAEPIALGGTDAAAPIALGVVLPTAKLQ